MRAVYMNDEPPDMPQIASRNIRTKFLHHRPDGESRKSASRTTRGKVVLQIQDIGNAA